MHPSLIKSCLLALATASVAVAQIAGFDVFTQPSTPGSSIPAGQNYTIKWTPSSPAGQISIVLLEGASNTTLQLGPTIASEIESVTGSYEWAVPSNFPAFPYFGFKLSLDSDPMTFQYSTYFSITGLSASSSSISGTASTTTVANTSVTVQVSQVGPIPTTSTISKSLNTTSISNSSTSTGSLKSTTVTMATTTSKSATVAASTTATVTSTSASATSSSGAAGNIAIGGSGLIGALFIGFGMLL